MNHFCFLWCSRGRSWGRRGERDSCYPIVCWLIYTNFTLEASNAPSRRTQVTRMMDLQVLWGHSLGSVRGEGPSRDPPPLTHWGLSAPARRNLCAHLFPVPGAVTCWEPEAGHGRSLCITDLCKDQKSGLFSFMECQLWNTYQDTARHTSWHRGPSRLSQIFGNFCCISFSLKTLWNIGSTLPMLGFSTVEIRHYYQGKQKVLQY